LNGRVEPVFMRWAYVLGVEPGTFNVMVGSSSEQIRLNGSFEVR
jgi:hypothetical protein